MTFRHWGSAALAAAIFAVAPAVHAQQGAPSAALADPEAAAAAADAVFEVLVAEVAAQRGDVAATTTRGRA